MKKTALSFHLLLNLYINQIWYVVLSVILSVLATSFYDLTINPGHPNSLLNLLFTVLFGSIFGLFVVHSKKKGKLKIETIEKEFNHSILTVIPHFNKKIVREINTNNTVKNRLVTLMDKEQSFKDVFRFLEHKLSSKIINTPRSMILTSLEEKAGKTTIAANLAITVAQSGKKVLLIDTNLNNPTIATLFGLPKFSSGLLDYLTEKTETPKIYKPVKLTSDPNLLINLDILPTGIFSNIAGDILVSDRMRKLLKSLEYYDFVILDTAPITLVPDTISLARFVKDTILIIREGQTMKEDIALAISELSIPEITLQGLIVNDNNI